MTIEIDKFFDRQEYIDTLKKRIGDLKEGYRQNIAIIGDEFVGKTSIIFKFAHEFYDNRIIILYLEIRPESLSSFTKRFIGVLLYNFLSNSNIPLKEDLDFLIEKSSKYIPRTTEKIKNILNSLEKRKGYNVFSELLTLTDLINLDTNKFCVVILDEFHHLENIGIKNIKNLYSEWSKLLIVQKHTMYIVISSLRFKAKAILLKNLSLLFGNFELLVVEPFNIKTSEAYLNYKLREFNITNGLKKFIAYFTGGFPFYMEVISASLLKSQQQDLTSILESLLFDVSGILNQKFTNYIRRFLDSPHSQDYISILYLISNGHNKLKDIVLLLHKPKKYLNTRINQLVELDAR